jgi:hypothetical protein
VVVPAASWRIQRIRSAARLGVVAELLCHPTRAAAGAEPAHGAADRFGHTFGGRYVRPP